MHVFHIQLIDTSALRPSTVVHQLTPSFETLMEDPHRSFSRVEMRQVRHPQAVFALLFAIDLSPSRPLCAHMDGCR